MRDRSYLFKAFYWRRQRYRFAARFLIRPAVALRGLPLVTVTGTNGKTTVTLLVNRILGDAGYFTGCTCTEGILIGGRWGRRGDEAGAKGLWRANLDPRVEALVAETARGGLLRSGPGFTACDVSVVTNVHENHLGHRGVETLEQMAAVKSILPRRTRPGGVAVLNYDQPLVRDMASKTPARVVYFSLQEPPASVSECFFADDDTIFRKRDGRIEPVIETTKIGITEGGVVRFQIANAMAALAVIEALQPRLPVSTSSLERSLGDFAKNPRDLPGRFQLFRYRGVDVLLSSAKNPECYAQELPIVRRLARALGYRRLAAVLTEVGSRQESHYHEIARAVSEIADVVACVPPRAKYLRGFTPEKIVRLLSAEVDPAKRVEAQSAAFDDVVGCVPQAGDGTTLFLGFLTQVSETFPVEEVLAKGTRLPLRFDG